MRSVDLRSVPCGAIESQQSSQAAIGGCGGDECGGGGMGGGAVAYPECEVGEALGQAWQRLEACASLRNEGEGGSWAGKVSAGKLDALGLAGFVLEGS